VIGAIKSFITDTLPSLPNKFASVGSTSTSAAFDGSTSNSISGSISGANGNPTAVLTQPLTAAFDAVNAFLEANPKLKDMSASEYVADFFDGVLKPQLEASKAAGADAAAAYTDTLVS
jgi:hypothetical protein